MLPESVACAFDSDDDCMVEEPVEELDLVECEADGKVIHPVSTPISTTRGVMGLKDNLALDGAIVKVAGMAEDQIVFADPARVFECEEDAFTEIRSAHTRKANSSSSGTNDLRTVRECARCSQPLPHCPAKVWARRSR